MTPESTTAPVREITLKKSSSRSISATRNALIGVEPVRGQAGTPIDIALPQLPARARHEVHDVFLGLGPLVEVIVAREDDLTRRTSRTAAPRPSRSVGVDPCRSPDE